MKKYKILVTGHVGFIGSRLFERLKENGHQVFGYDISNGDDLMDFIKIEKIIKDIDIV